MVRLTTVLARIPVIKFRKGGGGSHAPSAAAAAGGSSPPASASNVQQATNMSSSAIPDINLPARYQRRPISDEEIAHINGGGIV